MLLMLPTTLIQMSVAPPLRLSNQQLLRKAPKQQPQFLHAEFFRSTQPGPTGFRVWGSDGKVAKHLASSA